MRQLKKLDRTIAADILDYMDQRIAPAVDPRAFGKALRHEKLGLWRYRVQEYRIVCELAQSDLIIVHAIGHRSTIYD